MTTNRSEQAGVLALTKATPSEWYKTAALITEAGSAMSIIERGAAILHPDLQRHAETLLPNVTSLDLDRAEALIERAAAAGAELITVLDEGYPANLHHIYNKPPFIFVRGTLLDSDHRSIAIVGTRTASDDGRQKASTLARELAEQKVTVLSGLALGADAAAHAGALSGGGRTVAVIGTGILAPMYPRQNRELAKQIEQGGALVSQFWPDAPPTRYSFPMRNVVMSGMALGTVVVEASSTSGAKMQARLCLEHGKRLFLLESLVSSQEWAQRYAERPGVTIVRQVEDVVDVLVKICQPAEQMTLAFS